MKRTTPSRTRPLPSRGAPRVVRESLVSVPATVREMDSAPVQTHFRLPSRFAAALLVAFFFAVPVADAYAYTSEVGTVESASIAPAVSPLPEEVAQESQTDEITPTVSLEADAVSEDGVQQDDSVADPLASLEAAVEETPAVVTPPALDVTEATPPEDDVSDTVPHEATTTLGTHEDGSAPTENLPESEATTTPPIDTPDITPPEVTEGTTTPDEVAPLPTLPVATTTSEVVSLAPTTTEVVVSGTHTTDADAFSFSRTECVPLGNGAFQCVRQEGEQFTQDVRGDVYAARDAGGDFEIYLNTSTSPRAITNNDSDDTAPSRDAETGDVVWHAQLDDRSQIMHYNHKTGATTRLTKEAYNSMQPVSFGGDVVFQSWIGDDWEVVFIDADDGREILTDNDVHDIAPSITKEFIMWQSFEEGVWVAKVFDRRTKEVQTVKGIEGGAVANPRMIMVFDNKKGNGDVETVGYDPVRGEVVPLAVTPVSIPERIPEPEEKQEEKALVQPTTGTRIETKSATSTGNGDDEEPETPAVASTTPVSADIGGDATGTNSHTLTVVSETAQAPLSIPDLVIPPFNEVAHEATSTTSE